MKITKHRDKILKALGDWFQLHKEGPTLEELCTELGMKRSQKATLQRWLQTMRGIDVEWQDNIARSLRLLSSELETEPNLNLSATETLRYLATGLVEWENQDTDKRGDFRKLTALRLGMSRMYAVSLLQGDQNVPSDIPQFFAWAKNPVVNAKFIKEIKYLSPDVSLIEDGSVSNFASQWSVNGNDVVEEVQEKVLQDVLKHCRGYQLDEAYREFRQLIIRKPVLDYPEYRRNLTASKLRDLRDFLGQCYISLSDLFDDENYHFCPRCQYVMRRRNDGNYSCRNSLCQKLSIGLKSLPTISRSQADSYKIVTPGVYRYVTLPGIWEIKLAESLTKLGFRVTLWPEIDEFDLLVEFGKKVQWAIDLKDWSSLDEEKLHKVKDKLQDRSDFTNTFVVFPDERELDLRIKVVRSEIEPQLEGLKLRLMSEIVEQATAIKDGKSYAKHQ